VERIMSERIFKTVLPKPVGSTDLIDLSPEQENRKPLYEEALQVADKSVVANPPMSCYFCKESIGPEGGEVMTAGNIEYGLCQALHGEVSAGSAFRSRHGRGESKRVVLGILADETELGLPANPCGDCRDFMLEDLGEDLEIVCGAKEGGVAIVVPLRYYLVPDFGRMSIKNMSMLVMNKMRMAIRRHKIFLNDEYSPEEKYKERKYHAAVWTGRRLYCGARDIEVDYHPTYAFEAAALQAKWANDPFILYAMVICEDLGGRPPHVMYRDRQSLLMLHLRGELIKGVESDPPVYLATYHPVTGELVGFWQTSIKGWLPYPFSPHNSGPEFIEKLTRRYRERHKKFGRQ
jgi:cytidine deaminase